MKRINLFKSIPDTALEDCYHQFIKLQINKEIDKDSYLQIAYEQYIDMIGEKAAYAIMNSDLLNEIAQRWCKVYKNAFYI